ncbi:MAG: c-type cytochrome domain-containing protein [Singulisphaera sp.]
MLLDSREKIRAGGDRGPAVVPGDPDASLLLAAVSHSDPDLKGHEERLADSVIADIKTWIRMGAADPRGTRRRTNPARPSTSKPVAGSGPSGSPSPTNPAREGSFLGQATSTISS